MARKRTTAPRYEDQPERYARTKCRVCKQCWLDMDPKANPNRRCIYGGPFRFQKAGDAVEIFPDES